jgi:hypothetical protein
METTQADRNAPFNASQFVSATLPEQPYGCATSA